MASLGLSIDEQKAVDRFRTPVVEPPQTNPLLLDFLAEWCGPFQGLAPGPEKVASEYAEQGAGAVNINCT